ncbi:hypothetical protein E4U43_000344 [Claviceps pusilla]|uniref:Glycoside hydrolase family 43 protein n=1 Tax=Claviceps pusilla TaxID=123648 RepID=A0A9P7N9X9_9HYPO|nr:hypothetical protein E4U43_000344 [Claviceps pusilla]
MRLSAFAVQASASAVLAQTTFSTGGWTGTLAADSGVLQSLKPSLDESYDFSPSDYFHFRAGPDKYHTGDVTIRWRIQGQSAWNDFNTAALRATKPINSAPAGAILHSDFSNVSPAAKGKLALKRVWLKEGDDLVLKATVSNPSSSAALELGSFGFPIEFNSIFTNRTAEETTAKCNLIDPYIGLDAGYVQVTRLTGTGPNLVITPENKDTKFEAWRYLDEDWNDPLAYNSQVFEGFYSWEVLTKAWAENEWNKTEPWNKPTSVVLGPGKSVSYALRFTPTKTIPDIEPTVAKLGKPVAVGIPGYIVPHDLKAKLFLQSKSDVQSINVEPAGALTFTPSKAANPAWKAYDVGAAPSAMGRVRVTITYADGTTQTVHYVVTRSTQETASKLSNFFLTKSWFSDAQDPFNRTNSIIAYDYEARAQITQEKRVWIAGIADEAGSIHEAIFMKSSVLPDAAEIEKLELMANTAIWGNLQEKDGKTPYGVKRSLFYYDPKALPNYPYSKSTDWQYSWNQTDATAVWRAYDYVHVSAAYYSLYRAEQVSAGILKRQPALWYLKQAYHTVMASQAKLSDDTPITAYADAGLMGETIWTHLLRDLKAENLMDEFHNMERVMRDRVTAWMRQSSPFGSEMAWDSTGQEPIYAWAKYFNNKELQQKALNSIRGYMPTVAHWGWNGNARRYWDFLYSSKIEQVERMIHHYGSSLNALPLLTSYKYNTKPSDPAALYDLRVGFGGIMGPLSNVNADGFASTAFHSNPDLLKWDAYSGDYGPNYLGIISGSCTYLVHHPDFGWISMGGNMASSTTEETIVVEPRDTVRRSIYVAPLGLSITAKTGTILQFAYTPKSKRLTIALRHELPPGSAAKLLKYENTLDSVNRMIGQTSGGPWGGSAIEGATTGPNAQTGGVALVEQVVFVGS